MSIDGILQLVSIFEGHEVYDATKRFGLHPSPLEHFSKPMHRDLRQFGNPQHLGSMKLPTLSGVVAIYNRPVFHDGQWQRFLPGSFENILRSRPTVPMAISHNLRFNVPGTVEFDDCEKRLSCRIRLDDTVIGRELISAMRYGRCHFLSPCIHCHKSYRRLNGIRVADIVSVRELCELSFCSRPAQRVTSVTIDGEDRLDSSAKLPLVAKDRNRIQYFLQSVGIDADRPPTNYPTFPSDAKPKPATRRQTKKDTWANLSGELIAGFGGHRKFSQLLQQLSQPLPKGSEAVSVSW